MDRARHRVRFLKKDHDSIFYNPKFLLRVLCSRFKMRCVPLITEKCLGTVPTERSEMLQKKFYVQLKYQDHRTPWMKGVRHVEKIWLGETWKNQKNWKLAKGLTFRSLIWEIEDVEENEVVNTLYLYVNSNDEVVNTLLLRERLKFYIQSVGNTTDIPPLFIDFPKNKGKLL